MRSILISSGYEEYKNNGIFDLDNPMNKDNSLQPFYELKKELIKYEYEINTLDIGDPYQAEYIVFFDIPATSFVDSLRPFVGKKRVDFYYNSCLKNNLQHKMILFTYEPPVVSRLNWNLKNHQNFKKVFTWNDAVIDNKKDFKYHYAQPDKESDIAPVNFENKKLCTLVAGNKTSHHPLELYSERVRAIEFFEKNRLLDFDLYGTGWNKSTIKYLNRFITYTPRKYKCYRGIIKSKAEVLSKYKFCICYENLLGTPQMSGYITEKIFDCFKAECVPIYLGANNVGEYIPSNTFIDKRNFSNYEDLLSFMEGMSEEQYNQYIVNINNYLNSEKYYPFTIKGFIDTFVNGLIRAT